MIVFFVLKYKGYFNYKAYSKQALANPLILSFVLYIPIPTPPVSGKSQISHSFASPPFLGVNLI